MNGGRWFGAVGALALAIGLGNIAGARAATTESDWSPVIVTSGHVNGPLPASALRGRAVLVDVFTFECTNCTNVVPNLKRLRRRYAPSQLAIVGVHTPEVPSYQGRLGYVARNAQTHGISWPVVLDNDYRIWRHFGVSAWPTQLVFDRRGVLRATIVGDGRDANVNAAIARLVAENAR